MAYPVRPDNARQCFWIVMRALPLANAAAESSRLDNSPGNTDNQILGTRSLTRVSILVRLTRPLPSPRALRRIQNTCGAYLHTYLTNYHSQYLYRIGERFTLRADHIVKLYRATSLTPSSPSSALSSLTRSTERDVRLLKMKVHCARIQRSIKEPLKCHTGTRDSSQSVRRNTLSFPANQNSFSHAATKWKIAQGKESRLRSDHIIRFP